MTPTIHSPETIEAISSMEISTLKALADELHEATPETLSTPLPSAELERQMRLRTALKLKLNETLDWISGQEADLEAIKRDIRSKKAYVVSDESRLESAMFSVIRLERKGNA